MSVPIFYAADMSAAVFTMSLTENPSYPLINLHSNLPTLLWSSSAATNGQTLNIDLGSAKACDFIAFSAENTLFMNTVYLQYGTVDDGNFASPVNAVTLKGGWIFPFSSVTKRYWRIMFTDTNSLIPVCSLLLLGSQLALPITYQYEIVQSFGEPVVAIYFR